MYDADYTRKFYNAYGLTEWERLETRPYGRLQAIIHTDFITRYIKPGDKVLDAGAGPGRFSIAAAKAGAKVTVLDISDTQLDIAQQKTSEAGVKTEGLIRADISDLSMFKDGQFDVVVCFGGALSYVCENRHKAVNELIRVTRPGGTLLVSAMSRFGPVLGEAPSLDIANLKNPEGTPDLPGIWPVLENGDLVFYSKRIAMKHAPMHLYTAKELAGLFKGCRILETAASNAVIHEFSSANEKLAEDPAVWATVVEMEKRLNHQPGLVDTGSHIILAARKKG
jgi:ubiquinone/menaquinone biosynthesis C-methylase UbiE